MKTHCVTFSFKGHKCWAVKSNVPEGVFQPEPRCGMSETDARELFRFLKTESTFDKIQLCELHK